MLGGQVTHGPSVGVVVISCILNVISTQINCKNPQIHENPLKNAVCFLSQIEKREIKNDILCLLFLSEPGEVLNNDATQSNLYSAQIN